MDFFGKNDYDKEVKTEEHFFFGGGGSGGVYLYISSKENSVWVKMTEANIEVSLD